MSYIARIFTFFALLLLAYPINAALSPTLEYLEWNTLRINNKLPLFCKKVELLKLLGTADSIVTPKYEDICASYFDKSFKYLYYGNTQFEISDQMAVISSIDFESSKITLGSPMVTLDKSVTLAKIKQLFPMAVKNAEFVEVDKKGKVLSVKISTSQKETDDAWILLFKNQKLIRIDHWIPC